MPTLPFSIITFTCNGLLAFITFSHIDLQSAGVSVHPPWDAFAISNGRRSWKSVVFPGVLARRQRLAMAAGGHRDPADRVTQRFPHSGLPPPESM
jgi:hypothetical protein